MRDLVEISDDHDMKTILWSIIGAGGISWTVLEVASALCERVRAVLGSL